MKVYGVAVLEKRQLSVWFLETDNTLLHPCNDLVANIHDLVTNIH